MRAAGSPLALLAAAAAPLLVAAQTTQPGPGLDQGQIALIVVGVIPIGLFIIFAIYKVLAIPCIPAPAPPAPTQRSMAATSKLTYEAYAGEADFNRPPTPTGRLSRTPSRSGSPEITNALMKALPTPAFRMLKQKGALSARGEVLKAVVLTPEEESTMTTEVLMMLAGAGVVADSA